jgi:hypothetical protein
MDTAGDSYQNCKPAPEAGPTFPVHDVVSRRVPGLGFVYSVWTWGLVCHDSSVPSHSYPCARALGVTADTGVVVT